MTAYLEAMRRYVDFTGRSNVSQFWQFMMATIVVTFSVVFIDLKLEETTATRFGVLTLIVVLTHVMPLAAVTARRLHDTDRSGWWAVVGLIPFANVVTLMQTALPTAQGRNRFGDAVAADAPGSSWNPDFIKPDPSKGAAVATSTFFPAAAAGAEPIVGQLERLAALRASGAIDEAEFARIKAQLIP